MEVVNENSALLSNQEVYTLLRDIQSGKGHKKPNHQQQNLATVSYETVKYLEKKPCEYQTPEIVQQFIKKLQPYNLTKAEKLQLLNLRPTSAVEIQLLIEESEERLTEEQTEEILNIVEEFLPIEQEAEEAEEMDQA